MSSYCNFDLQPKVSKMAAYTEGTLNKLSKKELIGITLSLQNKFEQYTNVSNNALEEIRKFNENFVKLESEINIVKNVNTLLNKRVIDMERQCWADAQYSRRELLESEGIPLDVPNENLESKVLEVFSKVGCAILSRDIEACHPLTNNDRVIVNFLRRKDCDQVLSIKRDQQKIKLEDIGSRGSNSIFINPSLCPYYRMLWSKSKRLLDLGKINNFYVSSGKIKIRIQENSKPLSITHVEDFKKYFPDVDLTLSP